MGKLVESTLISIGGDIGAVDVWGLPFIDDEYQAYSSKLLSDADALLLGRKTYQQFAKTYPAMATGTKLATKQFVDRMNSIPKHVASSTLKDLTWNARLLDGDAAAAVTALKKQRNLLKFGTGSFDRELIARRLVDEFHLWIHPVAMGKAQRLFDGIIDQLPLKLRDVHRFGSGIVVLVYEPK
jgi:dihydrofolate reductase